MSERERKDPRSLADLHDDALRETDSAKAAATERYMAWFDEHVDGDGTEEAVPRDRPSERRPRVAEAVEATANPESSSSGRESLRRVALLAFPAVALAAAALALWLAPRTSRYPTGAEPSSPRSYPPPAAPRAEDPCRAAIHARGDVPLIDDFEDGDELEALREARNGYWVTLSDVDPDGAEPVFLPSIRPDLTPGNRYALHVAGGRHTGWGVSIQLEFGPSCYDASTYSGIAFDARGPGRLYAGIRAVDAVPVARGGTCTEGCYRSHFAEVTLESGWKTYVLPWSDLHEEGATTPADPRRANSIEFLVRAEDTPYDLWIDDVRFVHDSSDGSAP
jgi:hypothetical protein